MRLIILTVSTSLIIAACTSSTAKDDSKSTGDVHLKTAVENSTETESTPGGKDADDLGRKIIAAFKKNDVKAYLGCIHGEDKDKSAKEFESLKENLAGDGLSDWSKVIFSRVKYHKGSQNLESFAIEFDYGTNYSGVIGGGNYAFKHEGRYYIHHAFTGARMDRN